MIATLSTTAFATHDDEGSLRGEHATQLGDRSVPADVEYEVVATVAVPDVADGVVDDVIGADGSYEAGLRRAAHAGDLRAEGLGDLHRERTDAARGADDEHMLACLDIAPVAQRLQRGQARHRDGGRLLVRQVRRHPGQLVRTGRGVFGERTPTDAEYRIAWCQTRHVSTDDFDHTVRAFTTEGRLRVTQSGFPVLDAVVADLAA